MEIAIVLVLIGLVVGGILVGRDLIKAAELRAVVSTIEKYKTAVLTFKLKYYCLPGDCSSATQFWGTDTSCPFQPARTTPTVVTCDGDGNGRIAEDSDFANKAYESWRFWQQLANAGMIPGSYAGTSLSGNSQSMTLGPGITSPSIYKSSSGIIVYYLITSGNVAPGADFASVRNRNIFEILAPSNPANGTGILPVFTPAEMYSIDSKIDDGNALTGNVVSGVFDGFWLPFCLTNDGPPHSDSVYNMAVTSPACTAEIAAGF